MRRLKPHEIDTSDATDGDALVYDAASDTYGPAAGGGGGSALTVQDENSNVATDVAQIDFQGDGVTVTPGTGEVIVTIPGAPEPTSLTIQDENATVATEVTQIDFVGATVAVTEGSGEVIVTIDEPEAPPAAASDLTTMFVPLVSTDENGDFGFIWSEDGELIYLEVPL